MNSQTTCASKPYDTRPESYPATCQHIASEMQMAGAIYRKAPQRSRLLVQVPSAGVLLEGEELSRGVQPGVHPDLATLSAQRLWQVLNRLFVRAVQKRGQDWHSRTPALRPRPCEPLTDAQAGRLYLPNDLCIDSGAAHCDSPAARYPVRLDGAAASCAQSLRGAQAGRRALRVRSCR